MAFALPIIGAAGALAGGAAQLSQALKPQTDTSKPDMARADLRVNPIPMQNVSSDLNQPVLTQSVPTGGGVNIPNYATPRNLSLMHILNNLNNGMGGN